MKGDFLTPDHLEITAPLSYKFSKMKLLKALAFIFGLAQQGLPSCNIMPSRKCPPGDGPTVEHRDKDIG